MRLCCTLFNLSVRRGVEGPPQAGILKQTFGDSAVHRTMVH